MPTSARRISATSAASSAGGGSATLVGLATAWIAPNPLSICRAGTRAVDALAPHAPHRPPRLRQGARRAAGATPRACSRAAGGAGSTGPTGWCPRRGSTSTTCCTTRHTGEARDPDLIEQNVAWLHRSVSAHAAAVRAPRGAGRDVARLVLRTEHAPGVAASARREGRPDVGGTRRSVRCVPAPMPRSVRAPGVRRACRSSFTPLGWWAVLSAVRATRCSPTS